MRRLLGTALLATALLTAAACGTATDQNPTAATTLTPPSSATLDRTAACAAFNKDMEQLKMKALGVMGSLIKAERDPALAAKTVEEVRTLFAEMQTSAEKHLATAGDPEFKAALTSYYEQVKLRRTAMDAAGQDVEKLVEGMDDAAFEAAADRIDKFCA
jgi:hypothetical protein